MTWIIGLIALTCMEIVLGIDNIIFVIILAGKLPAAQQANARRIGLGAAMLMRIALLTTLSSVMSLTTPVLNLHSLGLPEKWLSPEMMEISWRDIIMIVGGLFLLGKSVMEIHDRFEGKHEGVKKNAANFTAVICQIALLDIVFSLDSVITAVGMVNNILVMVTAVILAVIAMLVFSDWIARFVEAHPTIKMLAISFLMMIGVMLIAEGLGTHINKGYVYFAMAFSILVESLNILVGRNPFPHKE